MLAFEIEKYRRLNRLDIVAWYEGHPADVAESVAQDRAQRIAAIRTSLQKPPSAGPGRQAAG
jgi:hypothetical protein